MPFSSDFPRGFRGPDSVSPTLIHVLPGPPLFPDEEKGARLTHPSLLGEAEHSSGVLGGSGGRCSGSSGRKASQGRDGTWVSRRAGGSFQGDSGAQNGVRLQGVPASPPSADGSERAALLPRHDRERAAGPRCPECDALAVAAGSRAVELTAGSGPRLPPVSPSPLCFASPSPAPSEAPRGDKHLLPYGCPS